MICAACTDHSVTPTASALNLVGPTTFQIVDADTPAEGKICRHSWISEMVAIGDERAELVDGSQVQVTGGQLGDTVYTWTPETIIPLFGGATFLPGERRQS